MSYGSNIVDAYRQVGAISPWPRAVRMGRATALDEIHATHYYAHSTKGVVKVYRYLTGKDDAAFCQRVTDALNRGWQLYGQPALTFDQKRGEVICGQVIIKEVEGKTYDPEMDLSKL